MSIEEKIAALLQEKDKGTGIIRTIIDGKEIEFGYEVIELDTYENPSGNYPGGFRGTGQYYADLFACEGDFDPLEVERLFDRKYFTDKEIEDLGLL